jgi:hypothetical protein
MAVDMIGVANRRVPDGAVGGSDGRSSGDEAGGGTIS